MWKLLMLLSSTSSNMILQHKDTNTVHLQHKDTNTVHLRGDMKRIPAHRTIQLHNTGPDTNVLHSTVIESHTNNLSILETNTRKLRQLYYKWLQENNKENEIIYQE